MLQAKKKPMLDYKPRQQVLATDALLDVFGCTDRHTLDDANVVSAAFNATAQRASPLRTVKDAHFYHNPSVQTFHVTVYYNQAEKGGAKNQRKAMRMVADNMDEATLNFFRSLRFCNVSRRIRLFNLHIQRPFVDQLKTVAKQFFYKDEKLDFTDVTLADSVNGLDLLLAFPSFRELNSSTFGLLEQSAYNTDELLKSAASRGAFHLFNGWSLNSGFSEAAILDYAFGDYHDNGQLRKLDVNWPAVTKKFLINLVRACRECRSERKIHLTLVKISEDLDVDEFVANGKKHPSDDGVSLVWRFRFDDLPELNVEYKPCNQHPRPRYWGNGELRSWGTIYGRASRV